MLDDGGGPCPERRFDREEILTPGHLNEGQAQLVLDRPRRANKRRWKQARGRFEDLHVRIVHDATDDRRGPRRITTTLVDPHESSDRFAGGERPARGRWEWQD